MSLIFLLAGCGLTGTTSESSTEASSARPAPSAPSATLGPTVPTIAGSDGYDELANWSSGLTDPNLSAVAQTVGLDSAFLPASPFVDRGYIGVAPIETGCVLTLMAGKDTLASGRVLAAVMSRYDTSYVAIMSGDRSPQELRAFVDGQRAICRGEAPIPSGVTLPAGSPSNLSA